MQDRYAGDVGDFGKLGLLRVLFPEVRLGIAWWLVPDEQRKRAKNDGRYTQYLEEPRRFRHLDPPLFDGLRRVVNGRIRSVRALREADLLPDADHHDERLDLAGSHANSPAGRRARVEKRASWLNGALAATAGCQAVFLDPDNGLASARVERHHGHAPKHVFLDEAKRFLNRSQIVVIYHHPGRQGSHETQAKDLLATMRPLVGAAGHATVLRFKPYQPRFFVVAAGESGAADVSARVSRLMTSGWRSVFDCHPA